MTEKFWELLAPVVGGNTFNFRYLVAGDMGRALANRLWRGRKWRQARRKKGR